MNTPDISIVSAVVIKPGDKVLVVLHGQYVSQAELERFKKHLKEWSPEANWTLVCGAEIYVNRAGDVETPA